MNEEFPPQISFIVPTFNREEKLKISVESILKQEFSNFELILIDDASSPSLKPYFDELVERDSRVSVFLNDSNKGVSFSRNLGLIKAKGEFVCFVDSDDLISKNRVFAQLDCFSTYDLLVCDYLLKDSEHENVRVVSQDTRVDLLNRIVSRKLHLATLAVIWRREFLLRNCLSYAPELRNSEDFLFTVRAVLKEPRIHYLNQALVTVVKSHQNSLTGGFQSRANTRNKFVSHGRVLFLTLGKVSPLNSVLLFKKVVGFGLHFIFFGRGLNL